LIGDQWRQSYIGSLRGLPVGRPFLLEGGCRSLTHGSLDANFGVYQW
jgi:hypothetical protein